MKNLTLNSIQSAYKNKTITPRQLILSRLEMATKDVHNAWITLLTKEQVEPYLQRLEAFDTDDLPLYGIPFAIKDNIDLENIPTSAACKEFTYTPKQSAHVVSRLIAAGAVPLGKTNMDQFATGLVGTRSPFGQGKNVFNKDFISGGSSSGSAIATSLGHVSFALGTDTAGSGRVPAVLNNIIGHKPTKGLVSCTGVVPACRSLDCVSIFSHTANDAAQILDVAADFDESDFISRLNIPENKSRYFSRSIPEAFTFGVPNKLDFFGNSECEHLFSASIEMLAALGGRPVTIDMEPFLQTAQLLYEGPWVAERWLATQGVNLEAMLPEIKTIIGNGNNATASDVFSAQYRLAQLKRICDKQLNKVEFAIAPTTPTVFSRKEIDLEPIKNNSILGTYTNFMNLLDYSATAIPVGRLSSGVHWGITLFDHAFRDIKLLNFAEALQNKIGLPLGAEKLPREGQLKTLPSTNIQHSHIDVAVCGAHLGGQPLNWQLTERFATLKAATKSSARYKLYALADGKRPGMVRAEEGGESIDLEIWSMPSQYFGSFVANIPAPLGIGKVETESGDWLCGFICDSYGLEGATDITAYKSWRSWLNA